MTHTETAAQVTGGSAAARLRAIQALRAEEDRGERPRPETGTDVNGHIHTTYSFSPYTPSGAVWAARQAGLATAGLMDHDSIAGAPEFLEAARIAGLPATVGMECRVSFADTPFAGRRINNPDQVGVAYMALHGVPHDRFFALTNWMRPYRAARMARSRRMTAGLCALLAPHGLTLDFDRDVWPLSQAEWGGSVTERHILYAAARAVTSRFGAGPDALAFAVDTLGLTVPDKTRQALADGENPYYDYDLLGLFKTELLPLVFIPAGPEECPPAAEAAALARRHDILLAYAYLGDVGDSPTGDKRAQTFEDGYLEELFDSLAALGVAAVTYMPSRNTAFQLDRVRALCDARGLFQISGEDINSPRQNFICEALRDPKYQNLRDGAWALIGHESRATLVHGGGLASPETVARCPNLSDRVAAFKAYGLDSMTSHF
ncbi:MAG: PHP domain-containing protein [Oscillospiraceae bacterium]|nr:PHP domain-containing protein [Oscillospiraceae bacterium]